MNYREYGRDELCFDSTSLIECGTLRTSELVNMVTVEDSFNSAYNTQYGLASQCNALEGMIFEEPAAHMSIEDGVKDVYVELAEKDHYLMLAAEAGKVLLEKNQELERQYQVLHNEYVQKIEELEQERHFLKQELSSRDSTYESRIIDLQSDLDQLGNELIMVQRSSHSVEKSQKSSFHDLSEQNELLLQQLNEVKIHNQALASQVQTLRQRIDERPSSPLGEDFFDVTDTSSRQFEPLQESDRVHNMKNEVLRLNQRKKLLAESINELSQDREMMLVDQTKSVSKLSVLEQELGELKQQIRLCQGELDSSKQKNKQLTEQLESLVMSQVLGQEQATINSSLLNELEISLSEADVRHDRDQAMESTPKLRRQNHANHSDKQPSAEELAYYKLKKDLCDVYRKLKRLRHRLADDAHDAPEETDDEIEAKLLDGVTLVQIVDSLIELIHERVLELGLTNGRSDSPANTRSYSPKIIIDDDDSLSGSSGSQRVIEILEQQVHDLNNRLNCKTSESEGLKKSLASAQQSAHESEAKAQDLTLKTNAQECELLALRKERDILLADVSVEEKLRRALEERDEAMRSEIEVRSALEQAQSDMYKLNSQLIAAAQHKLELSEQLEQWQFDMAALIDKQLEAKLNREQKRKQPALLVPNSSFFASKLNFHFHRKQKVAGKLPTPGNQSPASGRK